MRGKCLADNGIAGSVKVRTQPFLDFLFAAFTFLFAAFTFLFATITFFIRSDHFFVCSVHCFICSGHFFICSDHFFVCSIFFSAFIFLFVSIVLSSSFTPFVNPQTSQNLASAMNLAPQPAQNMPSSSCVNWRKEQGRKCAGNVLLTMESRGP